MPLIHSKTPKAFKENVKEMYEHGHPLKQSLAAAYSEQRSASNKMAKGGSCIGPECSGCSAPQCYAEGGSVDSWTKRSDNEKGIHKQSLASHNPGVSQAGTHLRVSSGEPNDRVYSGFKEDSLHQAVRGHKKVLGEMRSMKKPNLYAEGGRVGPLKEGNWAANEKEPMKLAGGGEIEDGEEQMGQEMHHIIGGELMDALERKDKKGIMDALRAAVMECMNGEYDAS
jgi:hypothetical protein